MKTIEIPLQTRAAAVTPASADKDKRTVELVWSTGAAVRRVDWRTGEPFIEELSMDPKHVRLERLNGGAPLLNSHNSWDLSDVLGVVEKAWLADDVGRAIARFASTPDVENVWGKVQDGIVRQVSIGYRIFKVEEIESRTGDKVKTRRAIDWEPFEISMVPIGADSKAGVRGEAPVNSCEIIELPREIADNPGDQATAGQAAPPAERGGVEIDLLRRQLDLAALEI